MNHFHDNNGWLLIGIDRHPGIHWPTPIPMPMIFWELNAMHPFIMGGNQKPTVQLNGGHNAVVDQHTSHLLWPHFPVIPDPLNMLFPLDLLFGKHKTWLPRGTVHICGTPAAITLIPGPLSINMDCFMGAMLPTSLVFQPGTVVTTASWRDYLKAGIRLAVQVATLYIKGKLAARKGSTVGRGPAHNNWSNARRNASYIFRSGPAGQRARTTFRNTLGREFMSRLLPLKVDRTGRSPRLTLDSPMGIANWLRGKSGIKPQNILSGENPFPGGVNSVLTNTIPGYGAVQGIQQGGGQFDWNPFS